jgi:hypothetical protein
MSELRVIELLDGLCDALSNFALWTPSAAWIGANPEADHDRRWVRITGAGADVQGATGACGVTRCAALSVGVGCRTADARFSFPITCLACR